MTRWKSEEERERIRKRIMELKEQGLTLPQIAGRYGESIAYIWAVIKRGRDLDDIKKTHQGTSNPGE